MAHATKDPNTCWFSRHGFLNLPGFPWCPGASTGSILSLGSSGLDYWQTACSLLPLWSSEGRRYCQAKSRHLRVEILPTHLSHCSPGWLPYAQPPARVLVLLILSSRVLTLLSRVFVIPRMADASQRKLLLTRLSCLRHQRRGCWCWWSLLGAGQCFLVPLSSLEDWFPRFDNWLT